MRGFRVSDRESLFVILIFVLGFIAKLTEGTVHYVGGSDGWVLSPFESYNHWGATRRFQINDTLVFTYTRGDSVLVVNEPEYNTCNTTNPIISLNGGYSTFKLDRPGPFFFISGQLKKCYQAQKMIVVVVTPRTYFEPPVVSPFISPFPSEALPPAGAVSAPSQAPSLSYAKPPSAGISITPETAPSVGAGIIRIPPAFAPVGTGIGIAPASEAPSPGGGFAFPPAYGPTQPKPTADAFTNTMSWLVFGLVFMVYV